ncbi:S9 family peptidase [Candidatus Tisiphia endosymbiont of Mystacides longicornis]|uniref:S9 family peptidase n=1 Tax=Candidatus Tisiphia endosymbiont of Mystacides longicornis TaxID=3139330 RepID=UPI003CCA7E5C
MQPPIANKIDYSFTLHGKKFTDQYNWLRDIEWPNVSDKKIIEYLQAENKYSEQFFEPLQKEKDKIFEELKGRIKLADQSTYVKKDNYYYYTRTEENAEYPIYCRKIGSIDAPEEIILDINVIAKDNKFTDLGLVSISPDHMLLAYSVDFTGDEKYTIKVYNLKTKEYLPDEIHNVSRTIIWHEYLKGFFYMPINENFRHDKLMIHFIDHAISDDKLVHHITDPLYQLNVSKSSSRQYIFVDVSGHDANETYVLAMWDHSFEPKLLRPLKGGVFYDVEHNGDNFYINTNEGAKNFRIVLVNVRNFQNDLWENNYIPEDPTKYLASFNITNNYLIVNYRDQGLPVIKIKHLKEQNEKIIHFPDAAFTASAFSTNFNEDDIRVNYSSLARPNTTYSYDFNSEQLSILKVQEIPSGFNPEEYMVERIFADNDRVKVPITLLYKKSLFNKDGKNPLYLYGYGSYGISIPVSFRNTAISLVDRGFVYALAHIRGGDDLGHDWYQAAKFLNKKRTFDDFIVSAKQLIKEKYTSQGNIVICGGSAGGMLIGAVINEQPELFKAALAHVPFVDVLNTMLDEELPLTPSEFKEWGNPKELDYFNYIKSYSPYDNIKAQNYPSLFITAGISDPRVGYWEAAKWAAKIRATKTDNNILLLKTNMDSGHKGSSGRFDYLKEAADEIIFIFRVFGISQIL